MAVLKASRESYCMQYGTGIVSFLSVMFLGFCCENSESDSVAKQVLGRN